MAGNDLLWMKEFLQDDLYLLEADRSVEKATTITPVPEVKQETITVTFNCLGRADTGFLILVNYTDEEHIDATHLQSLTSILSRKNIKPEAVTILNLAKQSDKTYDAITKFFAPKCLLIMGSDALPEGLGAPVLNTIVKGEPAILHALSFAEMDNNDKKRAFWDEMKNF